MHADWRPALRKGLGVLQLARTRTPTRPLCRYEEVQDVSKLASLLEDYMDEYNMASTTSLNLGEAPCLLCEEDGKRRANPAGGC